MKRDRGRLAIVLHTHMPFVVGHGTWPFGEEWLWRAAAESYLRLEDVLARHALTVGVTPVLADQFQAMRDTDAGDRMLGFIGESREYVFGEDIRSFHEVGKGEMGEALKPQLEDYRRAARRFDELGRNVAGIFAGAAESLAGPQTHPILPLLATGFGQDLQLATGLASHRERFANWNGGLWLSECAYIPGNEQALARAGVKHFCTDQSHANGSASLDNLEPVALDGGAVAAPIDWQTVEALWSERGYPYAAEYRSSFDVTLHALMPRRNDGAPHDPDAARARAAADAADFLRRVRERLDAYAAERGRPGLCVVAIDTELLGHWWYEGPWWLEAVCEQAAAAGIELSTLSEGIAATEPVPRALARSSWGEHKDLSTWDSPRVTEIANAQRRAELELFDALGSRGEAVELSPEAALRAARELLALQSSDWAFLESKQTAGTYAADRFRGHLDEFRTAFSSLSQSTAEGGEGVAATTAGLAPRLTPKDLIDLRCAH